MNHSATDQEQNISNEIPFACSLSAGGIRGRFSELRELGRSALRGVEVDERRAVFRFSGEPERVEAFVATESKCCPFLTLHIERNQSETIVEILAPEGAEPMLRSLVASVVAGWETGVE